MSSSSSSPTSGSSEKKRVALDHELRDRLVHLYRDVENQGWLHVVAAMERAASLGYTHIKVWVPTMYGQRARDAGLTVGGCHAMVSTAGEWALIGGWAPPDTSRFVLDDVELDGRVMYR